MMKEETMQGTRFSDSQKGQSIVIIAFVMVGLLAMTGLAVDVGLIFARSSQLQAAVDAAALAAVTEVQTTSNLGPADTKAVQFLNANGVPISVTQSMQSSASITTLRATEYSLTATWPVDLFFLKLVGQEIANVTKSATAAYFTLTDIYASRRVESGVLSTSNQAVFGPYICTNFGDPYSPFFYDPPPNGAPAEPNPNRARVQLPQFAPYTYEYRVYIPSDYPSDIVRIELFDPDSINRPGDRADVAHSPVAVLLGDPAIEQIPVAPASCGTQLNPCLIDTGEDQYIGQAIPGNPGSMVELDHINPFWFVRIDENRGTGGSGGTGVCGNPGGYDTSYNTQTVFSLYYYRQNANGSIQKIPLTQYTGQVGDGVRDNGDHDTDMRWVSPGAAQSNDQPVFVPVDPGESRDFEISISQDLQNIITDPATGVRYIYLGVTTVSGASENGFEVWAGPPDYIADVPSEVNLRNLYILENPGSHSSRGATVFGLGNLPMNSNYVNPVEIPLIFVGPEYAGQKIFISLYDSDSEAQPPIDFFFDSISEFDWSKTFAQAGVDDPDGIAWDGSGWGTRCAPGDCNTQWVDPPYQLTVPGLLDSCDWSNPDPDDCTPFYGGRLIARYQGGNGDSYGWEIRLTGIPYLVK